MMQLPIVVERAKRILLEPVRYGAGGSANE